MKICMILKNNDLLNDNRVQKEARSLIEAGHEVTVLAKKTSRSAYCENIDEIDVIRIPSIFWNPRRLFVEKAIELDADVYHAHDLFALDIAYLAAYITGAGLVYDSHELWYSRVRHSYKFRLIRRCLYLLREKHMIGAADRVIVVSDPTAEILKEKYSLDNLVVIRNVPPMETTAPAVDLREKLGVAEDRTILLHTGAIRKWRGFEQMLRVLAEDARLVLVAIGGGLGTDEYEKRCMHLAYELGVGERFKIMKAMPFNEMIAHAKGADVGMCLTQNISLHYYTTLSNKFFEYAMAGLPVVVSDFPAMRELTEKYNVGKLVDPSDHKDIAIKIGELIENRDKYDAMRDECLRLVGENNWQAESKKLLQMYDKIPTARKRPRPSPDAQKKSRSILILGLDGSDIESCNKIKAKFVPEKVHMMFEGDSPIANEDGVELEQSSSFVNAFRAWKHETFDAVITNYRGQGLGTLLCYDLLSLLLKKKSRFVYFPFVDLAYELDANLFLQKFLNRFSTQSYFIENAKGINSPLKGFFI